MNIKNMEFAVADIRKHISEELNDQQAAELIRLVDEAESQNRVWTARGLKENMAQVLDGVVQGLPQIIRRQTDTELMLLVSVESLVGVLKSAHRMTLRQSIRASFPRSLAPLPMLEPVPADDGILPELSSKQQVGQYNTSA